MIDTHLGSCACGVVRYRVQGNPSFAKAFKVAKARGMMSLPRR